MNPDTAPRPDHKRIEEARFSIECAVSCLKEGGQGNRRQAARCMRDAAYILYEQAERIMQDGYRPEFMFLKDQPSKMMERKT